MTVGLSHECQSAIECMNDSKLVEDLNDNRLVEVLYPMTIGLSNTLKGTRTVERSSIYRLW